MSRSIKRQMTAVCLGLVVVPFITCLLVNGWFLEKYYTVNKEEALLNIYQELQVVLEELEENNGEADSETLNSMLEKGNVSLIVMDTEGSMVATNKRDYQFSLTRLQAYVLNRSESKKKVLEKTDKYEIVQAESQHETEDYLEMWGSIGKEYYFLIRSPMESIRESASISNQFLLYMGIAAILFSALLSWYFAKRITDPIEELAALSIKMANLDFNAKYKSGGKNEIGMLGGNFNIMSLKLEHAISELKTANNELQRDIEKKEKLENMRTEFLGNVSHELKTPIALIQGYAEGLKEGIADGDEESRDFYCDVIIDEANKMNQMVKNLLTLNQLEFGNDDPTFERFNIVELIRGVIQSLAIMAEQSGVKIHFRHSEALYVWADEFKTEQVIRNYLTNALHYAMYDKVVDVKLQESEGSVRISVFNTGNPIPEEDLPHLWDKFYKVDKARTREYGGNGIGLSIVKAIMDSFHKEFGVKNYDNGVEFWFELDTR